MKIWKTAVMAALAMLSACGSQIVKVTVIDKDTGLPIKGVNFVAGDVIAVTGNDGTAEIDTGMIDTEKLQISKKEYKFIYIGFEDMFTNSVMQFAMQEKMPPAEVTGLRIEFEGTDAVLKWNPSLSEDTAYYDIHQQVGLAPASVLQKKLDGVSVKLGKIEKYKDYAYTVFAYDKNGNKNKGKTLKYYIGGEKVELKKTAACQGKITGTGKGVLYAVLCPVYISDFENYDISPAVVKCDASGNFKSGMLPPGKYTVKGFEDLNGNGAWDGNWLGSKPEPSAYRNDVFLTPNQTANCEITLAVPATGVPEIVYEENPGYVELYNAAWKFAYEKISKGNTEKGFVAAYMDEGFNDHIYQWDTCFMMFFGVYGGNDFPAMYSVDNFYKKQRENGYICRVQSETSGKDYDPTPTDPHVNPPLFAWVEHNYYMKTGDQSRLLPAIYHNHKYFQWLKSNCRTPEGYYYTSNLGSGMDNSPREGQAYGWIDITSQMALFAGYMEKLCAISGNTKLAKQYKDEYDGLKKLVNGKMWDAKDGIYYDVKKNGTLHKKKTIASFWPMLASLASPEQVALLVGHLKNTNEFYRPHLFPTLAKSEPEYDPKGHYWLGAVWAPTTFMTIKGLEQNGQDDFAYEAALNHIDNMYEVYANFIPEKKKLPYKQNNIPFPDDLDGTKQIWECYSSEFKEPATRWDNFYYVRPKFVGWSGDGPIALFIENVIGIRLDAPAKTVTWIIRSDKKHGVNNLPFAGGTIGLTMEKIDGGKPVIKSSSTLPFDVKLVIHYKGATINQTIPKAK